MTSENSNLLGPLQEVASTSAEPQNPSQNEKLIPETLLIVVRDTIWSHLSYIDTPLWQQELFPIAGMATLTLLSKAGYRCCPNKANATADMPSTTGGAAFSILTWTEGEKLGEYVAKQAGWSETIGTYVTGAAFAGVADGSAQMIISTVIKLLTQDEEWSKFKKGPTQYWKDSIKKLGLSLTVGAIPGALWQIAFAGGVATGFGPIFTTALIAVAVATSNALCVKASEKIMQTECCQNLCGKPEEKAMVDEKHEAPCVSVWNCMSGLFACGKPKTNPTTTSMQAALMA